MRIALDNCCLGRLQDDDRQPRVREERQAVREVLLKVQQGHLTWVASPANIRETMLTRDRQKREDRLALLSTASVILARSEHAELRADTLYGLGFGSADASHLAYAEQAGVELFMTTDDRLLSRARRLLVGGPRVINPVDWKTESLR